MVLVITCEGEGHSCLNAIFFGRPPCKFIWARKVIWGGVQEPRYRSQVQDDSQSQDRGNWSPCETTDNVTHSLATRCMNDLSITSFRNIIIPTTHLTCLFQSNSTPFPWSSPDMVQPSTRSPASHAPPHCVFYFPSTARHRCGTGIIFKALFQFFKAF